MPGCVYNMFQEKMMKNMMKIICGIAAAVLAVSGSMLPCAAVLQDAGDEVFDEFLMQEFIDTMEADYLTMHFYVSDYRTMGIVKPEPVLGTESYESFKEIRKQAEEMISHLETFDYEELSAEQQADYNALMAVYEDQRDRASDADFCWLFLPGSNVIQTLATNFIEFPFRTEEDFADYVTLLRSVPSYLDSALSLTEEQASCGFFMPDAALDETLQSITAFLAVPEENPLITDFEQETETASMLSDGAKTDLRTQVRSIVMDEILPACQDAADRLEKLRGSGSGEGVSGIAGGSEYYAYLVRSGSSSAMSPEELFSMVDDFLRETIRTYAGQLRAGTSYGSVGMTEPEEVLSYLTENYDSRGFPQIAEMQYTLEDLDPSSVSDQVLAYYLQPPADDYRNNVIRINRSSVTDPNQLYQTLAHEGYPGHMYQNIYYRLTDPNPVRLVCGFPGYTEGWAMYAEIQAMNWDVVSESDAALMISEIALNYALTAAADLYVNGLCRNEDELAAYFRELGLNEAAAGELYRIAVCYPGDYVSYGCGMVRMLRLREEAENALGRNFDEREFHAVVLDGGPRMFEQVEEDAADWAAAAGGLPLSSSEEEDGGFFLWAGCGAALAGAAAAALIWRSRQKNPFA